MGLGMRISALILLAFLPHPSHLVIELSPLHVIRLIPFSLTFSLSLGTRIDWAGTTCIGIIALCKASDDKREGMCLRASSIPRNLIDHS